LREQEGSPRFEALLLRLHASIDIHEFWGALLSIFDQFLPHDACVAYLDYVDYATSWDASQILMTPNAHRSREWLERRREVNMMPAFALSNPGIKLYRLCEVMPDRRRLCESEFFRLYMAAEGWHYCACALFWRADTLASEIAIRRTGAERELVHFVRIGFSNKEIAARLDKSVRTVKTQLTSVYKKCGVRGRSRLLALLMPRLSYD
jgi:DNA-binding CsgD family transcriptional regulator